MKHKLLVCAALGIATVSANAQFNEAWAVTYPPPNPPSGIDEAYAVVRDARGNTYVTGVSTSTTTGEDYVTIKYSPTGAQLWESRYIGVAGNRVDVPSAMALDNDGNCYVTGRSQGIDGLFEMATIKLSTINGDPLEEVRESTLADYNYRATDIAVSVDGNVYITGYREHGVFPQQGDSQQYVTVRYDSTLAIPAGTNWPAIYDRTAGHDRGIAIALGPYPGNDVYVTGVSFDGVDGDWATVKYSGNGTFQWVALEEGTSTGGFKIDEPVDIAVDKVSSVFVTGHLEHTTHSNIATMSYNGSDGTDRWAAGPTEYNGTATNSIDRAAELAIETNFLGVAIFVYVTGTASMSTGGFDYVTLSYPANNATTHNWATRYTGTGGDDHARGITVAGNGNLYVTGNSMGTTDFDYATVKYNKLGFQQGSAKRYDSNGESIAWDVAVSCAGKLHVAGLTTPSNRDYLTILYTQVTTSVATSSYVILPGVHVSGNLASLTSSNDNYLVVRPGVVFSSGDFPAVVTVTGTSALLNPNELCFTLEASATATGLTQRIELYDYDSANWVILDERNTTLTDSVVHASAPYDARRFVGDEETPSAYQVKARVSYKQTGPVFSYPWDVRLDLTKWEVLD